MQAIMSDESGYKSTVSYPTLTHLHATDPNLSTTLLWSSTVHSQHHGEDTQTVCEDTDVLFTRDETASDEDTMQVC